ncbi:MAG: Crp/Fnr family transcriptional regulator [Treponema sp.]
MKNKHSTKFALLVDRPWFLWYTFAMCSGIDISMLQNFTLFNGFSLHEIDQIIGICNAKVKQYCKGECIFFTGQITSNLGAVILGTLHIQQSDWWGNVNILHSIKAGEIFGLAFAAANGVPLENDVIAATNTEVLFLDVQWIHTFDTEPITNTMPPVIFRLKIKLIQNLYRISAARNRFLTKKLHYLSCRSTRDKLLAYLSEQADIQESHSFDIPFDRQQLADYLSVERSAMSAELSRMQRDGLLEFNKNHFTLLH